MNSNIENTQELLMCILVIIYYKKLISVIKIIIMR